VAENNALDPQGLVLLTDKVREIASKTLPMDRFILLKQDAIVNRIGEEELFRACKEGVCVAELTERVSADYGARCDILKRDNSLVLKFELYSVRDKAILETFTEYDLENFSAMRALLDARLPDAFKKMVDAPKDPQDGYTVIFNANGGNGTTPAPEPRKTSWKSWMSAGGGGFIAGGVGGGIAWDDGKEAVAIPYTVGGAYLFFDAGYAEVFVGYSVGGGKWESANTPDLPYMHRTIVNAGVFAKYPIAAGRVKYYPILGIDWAASTYGRLEYDDGSEYVFDGADKRSAASALSALWVRLGGGIDFAMSKSVYLRAELLYGARTADGFENDAPSNFGGGAAYSTRQGHGPAVKIGIGINLD